MWPTKQKLHSTLIESISEAKKQPSRLAETLSAIDCLGETLPHFLSTSRPYIIPHPDKPAHAPVLIM